MRAGRLHVRVYGGWRGRTASVTAGYSARREIVLKLLNDSLATEIVCVLRYWRHQFMAREIAEHLRRVRGSLCSSRTPRAAHGAFLVTQPRFRVKTARCPHGLP